MRQLCSIAMVFFIGCQLEPMPAALEEQGRQDAIQNGDWRPLGEKVEILHRKLLENHVSEEGLLAYRAPAGAEGTPIAQYSDTLGWTSLWATAQSVRSRHATGAELTELARERNRTYRALDHLARVTGHDGLMGRTIVPKLDRFLQNNRGPRFWFPGEGSHAGMNYENKLWKSDNAKFQVTAWLLALATGLEVIEDENLKRDLVEDLAAVTQRIVKFDFRLAEKSGASTRFGDFTPYGRGSFSWIPRLAIQSPIDLLPGFDLAVGSNALTSVALARVHDRFTSRPKLYPSLRDDDYLELIEDGVYSLFGVTHNGNDFLAAVASWAILETDPPQDLQQVVRTAVAGLWERHRFDRHPIHTLLALKVGVIEEEQVASRLSEVLYTFGVYPLDRRQRSVDHRDEPLIDKHPFRSELATHSLPLNWLPSSSIYWKSNFARIVRPVRVENKFVHSGMDFLLAWWWFEDLRARGIIDAALIARLEHQELLESP